MAAYSFINISATLSGPGYSINLGYGSGNSEGGITIEPVQDSNTMVIGIDGSGMHILSANTASTFTVSLLKTAPTNAELQRAYNSQINSTLLYGQSTLVLRDVVRGDYIELGQVAFKRRPSNGYSENNNNFQEWMFDAITTTQILGVGTPAIG